ncbi:MAG TPA: cellulose binding domain-containing protein [Streptosporangiaceae bacterium]|nr:cellulose binding domain-containing protein [Streptosporangiaceae bacterium]
MPRRREALVVVAVLAVVVLGGVVMIVGSVTGSGHPASAAGAGGPVGSQAGGAALCNSQRLAVDGGVYTVQNNEWGSGAAECVAVGGSAGFTVTRSAIANSASGAPGAYPSIYRGCHWGACTPGSGLPVPVSRLLSPGTVTTTWATAQPGTGAYDVAYDIWFNRAPGISGQPDGAELMIWLNHNGPVRPFGSKVSTAAIGGRPYDVWFGKQAWNTISYSMVTGTTSVRDLDIGQFAADALRRGYIHKSWYLIDVEAGFELWQGGAGLATDSFAVNVPGSNSAPIAAGATTARPAPGSPPAAGSASCTVTYSVVHTWPGGLQAQAVLTNASTSPVSGWTLTWSFAGEQRVTDLWNGDFTQSGERVSVTNAPYDATIAPSASVTIGFTGTSTGSDAPPAAFQLNGTNCKT